MKTYITKQGDTFDKIAYKQLGSCKYTEVLINANRDLIEHFIFSAGEKIIIPDVTNSTVTVNLPPWRL